MARKIKILVHTCCAACASHVFSDLKKQNFEPIAYFYNPEVHGHSEHGRRLHDLEQYCDANGIEAIAPDYNPDDYFMPILPYKDKESIKYISDADRYRRRRCEICLRLLVDSTVKEAKRRRIKNFTTTMLCSPYKDHNTIWDFGVLAAEENNINFFYKDFRKGYWMGRNYARNHDMVIPAYCGCSESLAEGRLE